MNFPASDRDSLVSVVIPTFDGPGSLRIALASAVAQSYRNLEIIICDNASPPDPSGILAGFGDPRIRLHRNASNLSPTANTLLGVAMATGKHVAILGDDYVWRTHLTAASSAPTEAQPRIIGDFGKAATV